MKKIEAFLFIGVFLLLALAPAVGLLVFGPAPTAANEILAQPPELTKPGGSFNASVLSDAAAYIRDRFWLRQELVTCNSAVEAEIFHESASPKVLLGREGWLYFAETLDDFVGRNRLSSRQLWAAAHTLALIREEAGRRGVRLLLVPVPNKNTVYPAYMPTWASRTEEPTNYDNLLAALEAAEVPAVDLRPVMEAHREVIQLYHTLDSHWNQLGAALANNAVLEALDRPVTAWQPSAYRAVRNHQPDLYQMLYPAGTGLDLQYEPDREWSFAYARPIRSPEDQRIQTESEMGTGALLMFRDSFGNTLHRFLAEAFSTACFSRAMPYDLRLLDSESADTLILEIAERHLPWLAQRAPILLAPLRSLDCSGAQPVEAIAVNALVSGGDWYGISGKLPLAPDVDSPVWLEADGTVYEASPVGETPDSFAAYLPQKPETMYVCWRTGGSLFTAPVMLP